VVAVVKSVRKWNIGANKDKNKDKVDVAKKDKVNVMRHTIKVANRGNSVPMAVGDLTHSRTHKGIGIPEGQPTECSRTTGADVPTLTWLLQVVPTDSMAKVQELAPTLDLALTAVGAQIVMAVAEPISVAATLVTTILVTEVTLLRIIQEEQRL
jgi:hypothetical protein